MRILTCPACDAAFRVQAQALGPSGRTVRCGACGHSWRTEAEPEAQPEGVKSLPEQEPMHFPSLTSPSPTAPKEPGLETLRLRARVEEKTIPRPVPRQERAWRWPRSWLVAGAMALALAGLLVLGWTQRDALVAVVPASASLYSFLGAEAVSPVASLVLEDVTLLRRRVEGEPLLIVEGWVSNEGAGEVALPALEARLLDQGGSALHSWTFRPEQQVLEPGARASFRTRAADRRDAVSIDIDFLSPDVD